MNDLTSSNPNNSHIQKTKQWIETFVIGLNLCPFAASPFHKNRIRYSLSPANNTEALLSDFLLELKHLYETDIELIETSFLIHPFVLEDFEKYLGFTDLAEELIGEAGLSEIIQVAGFHPKYQFAGTRPEDPENYTNRSPFQMLHLLRESSISLAVDQHPDPASIPQRNIDLLKSMGIEKIKALRDACM